MRQLLPSLAALSLLSATPATSNDITQPSAVAAPAVSNMLPADVPLVMMVNTKPEAWDLSRFQLFQTASAILPFLLPQLNGQPEEAPAAALSKLNYTEDIKSWLGDQVALVMMPKIGSEEVSLDSSFLMLAPVKDERRLQAFLDKFKFSQQGIIKRQYKGTTIFQLQLPQSWQSQIAPSVRKPNSSKPQRLQKERSLEIAFVPGYIVAAQTAKPIERLLDTPKGIDTLSQSPQFQKTVQRFQPHQTLFTLYENPAKFLPLVESLAKDPSLLPLFLSSSVYSEQLKAYSALDASLSVQTEGLRWQINAYRQTPKTDIATNTLSPRASQVLDWIPAATYSLTAGGNLKQQWQTTAAAFSADPQLKDLLTQFRNFIRTSTGLDIERDITAWMDGEYVFFLYPTKGGLSKLVGSNFNLGIGFLVQTSDRAAAEATLRKLEQSVKSRSNGAITVASRSIKGEPVISWEAEIGNSSQSLFAHSWVNSNTLLITTGSGAMADLVPQPYISLAKSYTFTTATRSLPQPNNGYSYMNMGSFLSWLYGFLLPQYDDPSLQAFKEIPGAIRSISATSSVTAQREQYDGLVVLAPAKASR